MNKNTNKTEARICVVLVSIALPLFFIGFSIGQFDPVVEPLRPVIQWFIATLMTAWYIALAMALKERQMDRLANDRQRQMIESLTDGVTI